MKHVHTEQRGDVLLVTMNRPPANALDPALVDDLVTALDAIEAEPPAAVVLAGAGGFFCAGADLRTVPDLSPEERAEMTRSINRMFSGWHQMPVPVVGAITGHAVAGGFVLALCTDHRVASTSGRFGLTEVKVGIPYPAAAMAVVKSELSPPVARRLVLQGELQDAAAMVELGAFDVVVADDEIVPRALRFAELLAKLPRATYALVKHQLRRGEVDGDGLDVNTYAARAVEESRAAGRQVLEGRERR